MRRPASLLFLLALASCSAPQDIAWPAGPVTPTPTLLPASELTPPPATRDPGPAVTARAQALRRELGL